MRRAILLLALCACDDGGAPAKPTPPIRVLAPTPELDAQAAPVVERTMPDRPAEERHLACVQLGRIGGNAARDRLLELLAENTRDPARDGRTHLYAAVGLTLLADPGTAIDMLNALSRINPNDNVAALASEERSEEYVTIDAQLCDALLSLGLLDVEDELIEQLRRRHRIRVLIDAYAVLRRQTGLDLPYRYNGSYEDKLSQANGWQETLRSTRAERYAKRPFDAGHPRFRAKCAEVVGWLGGQSVTHRLMAHKILERVGPYAVPFLVEQLPSTNPIAQRQAAYMLGRLGAKDAAPALRKTLTVADADARAEAVAALAKLGDRDAAAQVQPLLADKDPEVRAAVANFLGALGSDAAALREAAEKEQAPAARTAMYAAALRLGDQGAAESLIAIFIDGEQHDREAALRSLEDVANRKAGVTALAELAERRSAARTLRGWFE